VIGYLTEMNNQTKGKKTVSILWYIIGFIFSFITIIISSLFLVFSVYAGYLYVRTFQEGISDVISIPSDRIDAANENKLVHLTGEVYTEEVLADNITGFSLKAIKLERNVEMYQWEEEVKEEDGEYIYKYYKDWDDEAVDSFCFHEYGYHNPSLPYSSNLQIVKEVKLGAFTINQSMIEKLDNFVPVTITEEDRKSLPSELKEKTTIYKGKYYYIGSNPDKPIIGDIRISYKIVPAVTVSIIAMQKGNSFQPYNTEDGDTIDLLKIGEYSYNDMFEINNLAGNIFVWLLRIAGFILMSTGLFVMIINILPVLKKLIPSINRISTLLIFIFSSVFGFAISLLILALIWIFYQILIGTVLFITGGITLLGLMIISVIILRIKK